MTDPISSAPRTQAAPRTAAVTRPVASEAQPVPETDRLRVGEQARGRSLIEADVALVAADSLNVQATGTVKIQRTFIERLIRYAMAGSDRFSGARTRFDASSGTYEVQARFRLLGMEFPFEAQIKPVVTQGEVGLHLEGLGVSVGSSVLRVPFAMRQVTQMVADQLKAEQLGAKADPRDAAVRLDLNSLLHRLGLPYFARVDTTHTKIEGKLNPQGDLVVNLKGDKPGVSVGDTPDSDLSFQAGPQAMVTVLQYALAPDYEVGSVDVQEGSALIHGKADVKEASALLNLVQLFGAIAAVRGGANPGAVNVDPARVRINLDLAVKVEGRDLIITPSTSQALKPMVEALKEAGLKARVEGKTLRVDVNQLVEANGGQIQDVGFGPEGLRTRMRFDLEQLFSHPILRGLQ